MSLENQIDPIDMLILRELTVDATISFVELSRKLKVSNTLIHQRVKKLKESGILQHARYRLDSWKLGYQTSAYTQIMLQDSKLHRQVEAELKKIPEIVECVNIVGRYALIVRIFARNNQHLRNVIYEKIHPIDGIDGTNTTVCFETVFSRGIPLEFDYER